MCYSAYTCAEDVGIRHTIAADPTYIAARVCVCICATGKSICCSMEVTLCTVHTCMHVIAETEGLLKYYLLFKRIMGITWARYGSPTAGTTSCVYWPHFSVTLIS